MFQCLTALRVFCFSGRTACPLIFADLAGLQKPQKTDVTARISRGYPPPVSRWDAVRHQQDRRININMTGTKIVIREHSKGREDGTVKTVPYSGSETWFVYRTRGKNQKVLRDGKPVPYRVREHGYTNVHAARVWNTERSKPAADGPPFPTEVRRRGLYEGTCSENQMVLQNGKPVYIPKTGYKVRSLG